MAKTQIKLPHKYKIVWSGTIPGKPISVNHAYSRGRNGRRFLVKEGKDYKQLIADFAGYTYSGDLQPGDCLIEIEYTFPDHRRRDTSNYHKLILDALEGIIVKDDKQFKPIYMDSNVVKGEASTEIKIYRKV